MIDRKAHDERENEHQGNAHRDTDTHLKRHLNVRNVRGQPRDERGGGKLIHVLEGKLLDGIK